MAVEYKPIKEIPQKTIYNFLLSIDHEIVPPMSSRINLKTYPEKIKALSIGIAVMQNDLMIGILVFYPPNSTDNYVYLTLIGIDKKFRDKKISGILIYKMIDTANKMNAKGIKTQTWASADKLVKFYKQFGFIIDGIKANRNSSKKSALLKLNF